MLVCSRRRRTWICWKLKGRIHEWQVGFGNQLSSGDPVSLCVLTLLSPPRSRTLKENRNIAFYPMAFGPSWVGRSTGICLLPQIQILLHEKWVRIAQTASFFPRLPRVRVLGNTSNLDCRLRIWPSCGRGASKSYRVELLDKKYDIHEAEVEACPGWSIGSMNFLAIIVGSWEINLAGMPWSFDPLWWLEDSYASEILYGHSYDVKLSLECIQVII